MTDLPNTPRFSLPLLAAAQAQKEVTHNEALMLVDALIQASIVGGPTAVPPAAPAPGQCWLVGAGATGDWSGEAMKIALWTAGGWRFAAPGEGMRVTRTLDGALLRFVAGAWIEPSPLAAPSGGAIIDSEARAAIAALISLLAAHGLLIAD